MICPGLVTEFLSTVVDHASFCAQLAPTEDVELLAIKKLELLFSHSDEPVGWPGYLVGSLADDEPLDDLLSYLGTSYLDFYGEGRCYVLP